MRLSSLRAGIRKLRADRREIGWRGLLKKHGWKPFALFVLFYLVRDTILYILSPMTIWAGFFG